MAILSFEWQFVFLLIHSFTKCTQCANSSGSVLISKVLYKRTCPSNTTRNDRNEVLVFGHRNPDTDTIVSSLVYAEYLRCMNINAKAYRLGDLNKETKFVLGKVGINPPDVLPSHVENGTAVALVDHNESQQSMEHLIRMRVTYVIDHHKLGDLTTSEPTFIHFEPVGCTATILAKLYREHNLHMTEQTALLLLSAILSDTLHFRSTTTTDDDRSTVNYLSSIAKIADIGSYADEMFAAKSDLTDYSMEQILLLDYKTYIFRNQSWGIGVAETLYPKSVLDRKDELLQAMTNEKKMNNLSGILFSVIDILQTHNGMVILGEPEKSVVEKAFNVNVQYGIADLGARVSRKKDVVPALELYFQIDM